MVTTKAIAANINVYCPLMLCAIAAPMSAIKQVVRVCVSETNGYCIPKPDNGSDHRVRTIDLPFQNHAQAGLRVHRIVMSRQVIDRSVVIASPSQPRQEQSLHPETV